MCALPIDLRRESHEILNTLQNEAPPLQLYQGLQHLEHYLNRSIDFLQGGAGAVLPKPEHCAVRGKIELSDKNDLINHIHLISLKYREALQHINELGGEHAQEEFIKQLKHDIKASITNTANRIRERAFRH